MKKTFALVLALLMLCLVFSGCETYSDTKPMSEKRVEKFLDEMSDQIEDDIEDWNSFEISIDMTTTQGEDSTTQKYSSIFDTKNKTMEIDMSEMELGIDGITKAYAKGDYVYLESEETGKIKVSVEELGMADMLDAASQQKNFLFLFEELDSEDLADMGVEIFVTKTDDGGKLYRIELTDEYYEYYFKKMPGLMEELGSEAMSEFFHLIKIKDVDIDTYELTYEFDKDGKLIKMTENVDMSYTIDMTDMMIEMFKEMLGTELTAEQLEAQGIETVMAQSVKGKSVMKETKKTVEFDESEYSEMNFGF